MTNEQMTTIKRTAMHPYGGKGRELYEFLKKELCIPEGVRWFEVRFAMDEAVAVTCHYLPQKQD
jgi:hypothetical protein